MTSANVFIGTSLDGFIAKPDGGIDWLMPFGNEEAVEAYNDFISSIDVIVIGRGTLEKVLEFPAWPYEKPVIVLSRSMKKLRGVADGKAELSSLGPADLMMYLSDKGFKAAYIDGGKVIQSFLSEDLIDTLIITKLPIMIGSGIPLFGRLNSDLLFEHQRTEACSNGMVRSYYRRKRTEGK